MIYLTNYAQQCKDTLGGCKRLHLLKYVYYNDIELRSTGEKLTTFPESYVYTYDIECNYTQTTQEEAGNVAFQQQITANFPKLYDIINPNDFTKIEFRAIIETNNGDLLLFGAENGLKCSLSNATGTTKSEFNGFTLTFEGLENKTALLIEDFDAFFNYFATNNLSASLNFKI